MYLFSCYKTKKYVTHSVSGCVEWCCVKGVVKMEGSCEMKCDVVTKGQLKDDVKGIQCIYHEVNRDEGGGIVATFAEMDDEEVTQMCGGRISAADTSR